MKKIADMVSGGVLIEMTMEEWNCLQRRPDITIYQITEETLEDWSKNFIKNLHKLNLSTRVHNAISRAASVRTERWDVSEEKFITIMPYIQGGWSFKALDGRLLNFEQWCRYVTREGNYNLDAIRNIGKKSKREILAAIETYLETK